MSAPLTIAGGVARWAQLAPAELSVPRLSSGWLARVATDKLSAGSIDALSGLVRRCAAARELPHTLQTGWFGARGHGARVRIGRADAFRSFEKSDADGALLASVAAEVDAYVQALEALAIT